MLKNWGCIMEFRIANKNDLHSIIRLLADDELGSQRERFEEPLPAAYYDVYGKLIMQVLAFNLCMARRAIHKLNEPLANSPK